MPATWIWVGLPLGRWSENCKKCENIFFWRWNQDNHYGNWCKIPWPRMSLVLTQYVWDIVGNFSPKRAACLPAGRTLASPFIFLFEYLELYSFTKLGELSWYWLEILRLSWFLMGLGDLESIAITYNTGRKYISAKQMFIYRHTLWSNHQLHVWNGLTKISISLFLTKMTCALGLCDIFD